MRKSAILLFMVLGIGVWDAQAVTDLPPVQLDPLQVNVLIKPDTITAPLFKPGGEAPQTALMRLQVEEYTESPEMLRRPLEYQVLVEKPGGCLFTSRFGASVAAAMSDDGKVRAARFHYAAQDYQQALATLEGIGESSPHYPISLYLRALSWKGIGDEQQSIEFFRRAARSASPEVAAESSLALATLLYNRGDMEYASFVRRYHERTPTQNIQPAPWLLQQIALFDAGEFEESVRVARNLEGTPFSAHSLYFRGHAYEQLREHEKAVESFEKAFEQGMSLAFTRVLEHYASQEDDRRVLGMAADRLDLADDGVARRAVVSAARLGDMEAARFWLERIGSSTMKSSAAYEAYMVQPDIRMRDYFARVLVEYSPFDVRNEAYLLQAEHFINTGRFAQSMFDSLEQIVVDALSSENKRAFFLFSLINRTQMEHFAESQRVITAGHQHFRPGVDYYDLWLFESAKASLLIGNLERAAQLYAEIPSSSAYYTSARFHLANLHTQRERYEEAERIYRDLLRRQYREDDVRISLAILYNNWGRYQQALDTVTESSGAAVRQRGHAFLKLGHYQEATRSYFLCRQRFDESSADYLECTFFQALSMFHAQDYDRTLMVLERFQERFEADAYYRERALRLMGDAHYNAGRYDRAQRYYARVSSDSFHSGYFNSLIMQDRFREVETYVSEHQASMDRATLSSAYAYLSRKYVELGDYQRAQSHVERIGDRDAFVGFARVLLERGEYDFVVRFAAQHREQHPQLRYYLGMAYLRQGNYRDAYLFLQQMLENPNYREQARHHAIEASMALGTPDVTLLLQQAESTGSTRNLAEALPILMEQGNAQGAQSISRALLFTYTAHRDLAGYAFAWSFEKTDPQRAIVEYLKVTYLHESSPYVQKAFQRLHELYILTNQPERAQALEERMNQGVNR